MGEYDLTDITKNYIYIYHLNKFCVIPSTPDSITESISTTFNTTSALGRSAPIMTYVNSGPRTMSFTLQLHRDMMNELNSGVGNLPSLASNSDSKIEPFLPDSDGNNDYVDRLIQNLQACALPNYKVYLSGSKSVEPPMVAIKLAKDMFIRGVITSGVSVSYSKPILSDGRYAVASITFTVTEYDPYTARAVAENGFRGIFDTNFADNVVQSAGRMRGINDGSLDR